MQHHLNIPDRLGEWILSHRAIVLTVFAVLTGCAYWQSTHVPIHASILEGLLTDQDRHDVYTDQVKHLGGSSDDLLFVATREGDQLFTPATLNSIRKAAEEMRRLSFVSRVITIVDVPEVRLEEPKNRLQKAYRNAMRKKLERGELDEIPTSTRNMRPYWPIDEEKQASIDIDALKTKMVNDAFAKRLMSKDKSAQMMLIWLNRAESMRNRAASGVRRQLENILKDNGLGREATHFSGTLVIQDWMFEEVLRTLQLVLPVTAIIVSLLTLWVFHRLSYMLLTLVIAAIAATWSVGMTAFLFGEITLLVAAVPALVMVISTADTIHLVSAYVAELKKGSPRDIAINAVFQQVGGACVLTSITTFVGFTSLLVVPAAAIRHLAIGCAIGVTSALLLALTLVPMALQILQAPPVEKPSRLNVWLDQCVQWCQHVSLNRPRTVVALHAIAISLAAAGASQLHYDADLPARFRSDHPLRKSIDFFNDEIFATSTIEIMVKADPEQLLSPEMLHGLVQLEDKVRELPKVNDVLSMLELFRIVDKVLDYQTSDGLPRTQSIAKNSVKLAERFSKDAVQTFVSLDQGITRVTVQVPTTRVVEAWEFSQLLKRTARECLPDTASVDVAGYYPIVGEAVVVVIESQIEGFYICFASVMAIVAFGVRSIRLAMLAVFPNLLPLLFLGGILGVFFEMVDSDVIGIAIISFGLAVDDTIHFLHRYDIEFAACGDKRTALKSTYTYTGSAIIRTTVILGVGLMPFMLSDYLSTQLLGSFLVVVLAFAVFGDLLLLPSLICLFGENENQDHDSPTAVASDAIS